MEIPGWTYNLPEPEHPKLGDDFLDAFLQDVPSPKVEEVKPAATIKLVRSPS